MITYIHVPIMAICFLILLAMSRWWRCINLMGLTREVSNRAPLLLQGDLAAAVCAFMPLLIAVADWSGVTLPYQAEPISSVLAAFLSCLCLSTCVFIQRNSGDRFAGHWAGTRESALRTVAALRIIDAAELARAIGYLHAREREIANIQKDCADLDVSVEETLK
jgi:hypothetical protein